MTATPPPPKGVEPKEPKLVIERDEDLRLVLEALDAPQLHTKTAALEVICARFAALRSERDEAQKRAEVAEAALAERAKNDEQIYRNAQSILAKIHGQKLEHNSQSEALVKTS